jgi:aspartate aminotransferase-like enzyme
VAAYCRERCAAMGLTLYGAPELASPTVTAVSVPAGWQWAELRAALLAAGVELGGSYGPLKVGLLLSYFAQHFADPSFKDKVMRVGHMGSQADMALVTTALDRLEKVLRSKQIV